MFLSFLILFLIFSILSWAVIQHPDNLLDQNILILFEHLHNDWLTQVAKMLALAGGLPVTLVVAIGLSGYGYLKHNRFICYFVLLGTLLTASTTWLLKWIVLRPRPVTGLNWVETYGSSYPSAHSAYAMMIACILLYTSQKLKYRKRMISFALVWCVVMGCSRIYVGAHYFTDVVAGWLWAGLIMLLIKMSLDRYGIK